jgi:hypothetical protein
MHGTLVLAILSIQSSYARDVERSLDRPDDVPDTLQWWVSPQGSWRIKTYALDHDIHTHDVGSHADLVRLAQTNNLKHYGNVIRAQHILEFSDCSDQAEVEKTFGNLGLVPRLEVAMGRFAFSKPDDAKYWTQSAPR